MNNMFSFNIHAIPRSHIIHNNKDSPFLIISVGWIAEKTLDLSDREDNILKDS